MSGGSQHNPNGRQSQLGSGWSPLQLQMANLLARAPQAHMASERGVTWHTPTPPPHLYHVPAPSPPDPLQAMKTAGGNSVYRHTATPPELYRHTPTPPDKHMLRHTPSPGDVKTGAAVPLGTEIFPHLGQGRDKMRMEEATTRGVDLSVGARSNGAALSVRDAPTINSLIARAQPRHSHARVDALLDRLVPSPVSPHSVIMHSRVAPTPSPPSSNEDSADSSGAPCSKRKRKPDRTLRLAAAPPPAPPPPLENGDAHAPPPAATHAAPPPFAPAAAPPPAPAPVPPPRAPEPPPPQIVRLPPARRKSRTGSAETIDDIAAMIASTDDKCDDIPPEATPEKPPEPEQEPEAAAAVTIDKLKSVLASPEPQAVDEPVPAVEVELATGQQQATPQHTATQQTAIQPASNTQQAAAAPRRRSARTSAADATNVPVESPSEAKPAEPEPSEPAAASFVEVENQLEKMFAGLEESAPDDRPHSKARKRRKSTPKERKAARRGSGASTGDEGRRGRAAAGAGRGRRGGKPARDKDAYDSGSNASSGRSRGPYIQIRGPRDSPLSVSVINAATNEEEPGEARAGRGREEFRGRVRVRGLHCSTLGLRYDATTPDATWLCAFCQHGPHHAQLGDLFGPYNVEAEADGSAWGEVWLHAACGVWAPGVVAAGARVWGLAGALAAARGATCARCRRPGAALACGARRCGARAHLPCAVAGGWALQHERFQAYCADHDPAAAHDP